MHAVLFDIGGTLLREDGYDLASAVAAARAHPALAGRVAHGERWAGELARWVGRVQREGHGADSLARWLGERIEPRPAPAELALIEDAMWDAGVRMSAMPGAREALDALPRGLVLGALSNTIFSARRMRLALGEAGLAERLAFVLSSADLGLAKPDRRAFAAALAAGGLPAEGSLYVGDSWANDVVGAHGAGMRAIWVAAEGEAPGPEPHRRLRSLGALPDVIAELGGG